MNLPRDNRNHALPVKWFLISYRALADARAGLAHLDEFLQQDRFLLSEWKVIWVGSCTLLRTCIDLFKADAKSCIDQGLRNAVKAEWNAIEYEKDKHPIFWEFLRRERNNIIHEYQWTAYAAWLSSDGTVEEKFNMLQFPRDDSQSVVIMRSGYYKGRNSLELLHEGADWVEDRIVAAIKRAGLDPDEERRLFDFTKSPASDSATPPKGILTAE